jgi:hypothetical protein
MTDHGGTLPLTEIEKAVYANETMKKKYAPKKQNNKKRPSSHFSAASVDKEECQRCQADVTELKRLEAHAESGAAMSSDTLIRISQLRQTVSVPRHVINDASGDCVCSGCGSVLSRAAAVSNDFSDFGRVYPKARARTRVNYINERMGQWNLSEPPIPAADRELLRLAYNHGHGVYDVGSGVIEFDPALQKSTVRDIIIRAGLCTKKYTEKWLSIRKMLGAPPHPMPSPDLISFIQSRFNTVISIWERYGRTLCPPGHERKSLFNYNYIITQLLLQHSVAAYDTHVAWFPVVEGPKTEALQKMWFAICREAEWPAYKPVWKDGVVVDRVVDTRMLPPAYKTRSRVKRRRFNDTPKRKQRKLDDFFQRRD